MKMENAEGAALHTHGKYNQISKHIVTLFVHISANCLHKHNHLHTRIWTSFYRLEWKGFYFKSPARRETFSRIKAAISRLT